MTSDAKVGLLLGLVFIVIIAFLINGLPNLLNADGNSEVINNAVPEPNNNWGGLRDQANEVVRTVDNRRNDARFETQENNANEEVKIAPPPVDVVKIDQTNPPPPAPVIITPPAAPVPTIKKYIVVSNDNLSKIAIKFYGPEEGNRLVNINKIFNANKNVLDSPDDVGVGQKLIIPSLNTQQFELVPLGPRPSAGVVERVKKALKNVNAKTELPVYTTKDGDSLWQIAASKLGDGSRYHEIVKLNKLEDPDTVPIGIKLKMPKP